VVKRERDAAIRELRSREEATRRAVAAVRARDEAIRSKDAEIARLRRLSELWASVDAKVKAAVKEALAQVADALKCACCFEPLAPGAAVSLECGHTYFNRQACASSWVTACPESAAHRSASRAALWGACQRVRASALPRLTPLRRVRVGGGRTEGRGERKGIKGHFVFDKCKSCVRLETSKFSTLL
jgi:hypothetical protein